MDIEIHDNNRAETFTTLFQHVKLFTDHINITFSEREMYIQAMDSSHIVIFELHLPHTWFGKYKYSDKSSQVVVGINGVTFFKILHTREKSQKICLSYSRTPVTSYKSHF